MLQTACTTEVSVLRMGVPRVCYTRRHCKYHRTSFIFCPSQVLFGGESPDQQLWSLWAYRQRCQFILSGILPYCSLCLIFVFKCLHVCIAWAVVQRQRLSVCQSAIPIAATAVVLPVATILVSSLCGVVLMSAQSFFSCHGNLEALLWRMGLCMAWLQCTVANSK